MRPLFYIVIIFALALSNAATVAYATAYTKNTVLGFSRSVLSEHALVSAALMADMPAAEMLTSKDADQ